MGTGLAVNPDRSPVVRQVKRSGILPLMVFGILSRADEGKSMVRMQLMTRLLTASITGLIASVVVASCGGYTGANRISAPEAYAYDYVIGPGDALEIFVWRNPDLSRSVIVRPDGKISAPLVEDLIAGGRTATQLANEIEAVLSQYIRDPLVTVIVSDFQGVFEKQVRVVGEATQPQALPYRAGMTALDVMIAVGGLTEFAAGNRAKIVRTASGRQREIRVRLDDLIKDGDINANVKMAPGDIVIIPEAWF